MTRNQKDIFSSSSVSSFTRATEKRIRLLSYFFTSFSSLVLRFQGHGTESTNKGYHFDFFVDLLPIAEIFVYLSPMILRNRFFSPSLSRSVGRSIPVSFCTSRASMVSLLMLVKYRRKRRKRRRNFSYWRRQREKAFEATATVEEREEKRKETI